MKDLAIIDMPGVDDRFYHIDIETFIKKNKATILPLFVIELCSGTFES